MEVDPLAGTQPGAPAPSPAVTLNARTIQLGDVQLAGPLDPRTLHDGEARDAPDPAAWRLDPLATADGTLRARIRDAHMLFDADVTVPLRRGQVDFNHATVEHVGPDSRMGVSRMGIHVDAAHGRSYLYQFPSTPVAGVEYERRGPLPGPFVADRGRLHAQAFAEWLLRQLLAGQPSGITAQARGMFQRTSVAGELRLGDGRVSAPGMQAELAGQAQGCNVLRLHSQALGGGMDAEIASLLLRHAAWQAKGLRLACDAITGALRLRLFLERAQLRFSCTLSSLTLSGLRIERA